ERNRGDRKRNRAVQGQAERAPEQDVEATALQAETAPHADTNGQHEEQPVIDTTAPITDEQGSEAAAILEEIITRMGIAGSATFVRSDDGSARINVSSEDSAILIGRKGRNLGAMQY